MLSNDNDWNEQEGIAHRLKQLSAQHMIIAFRANLTNYEILLCQEISAVTDFPLMDVLEKMAAFKQTSEHILYKKDFTLI